MRRFGSWVAAFLILAVLAACSSGPVRRVSPPTASIQQLTVNADGTWSVDLRLQNYSSIPMRFDNLQLVLQMGDQAAGTLQASPQISIGPESADVITLPHQPSLEARMVVADALASRRPINYSLEGSVGATPEDAKLRSFDIKARNTLNPVPGLDGVLR